MRLRGGKKLIPPTNLQDSDNEESSKAEPPPPSVNNNANGTYGPNLNETDAHGRRAVWRH